jgi:hypothetical protein
MPRGLKGEKRPADVIGNAVKVMRIAVGEDSEAAPDEGKNKAAISPIKSRYSSLRLAI